jgi:DNA-binding MarR family transcriptional regulator
VSESADRYGADVPSPEALDELTTSLQRLGRLLASRQATSRVTSAAKVDVSQQGAALLRTLRRSGRLPMAALASAAAMDLGAVSRQIRLLEGSGAVRRSRDPDDGRVALLELTPKGRRMADQLRAVGVRHLDAALSGWSEADGRALAVLLGRLVDDLLATPVPVSTPVRRNAAQR